MSEKELIIVGAGDLGREIMYAAMESKNGTKNVSWKVVAFVDENPEKIGTYLEDVQVISFEQIAQTKTDDISFALGVGNPITRRELYDKLLKHVPDARFATIIHRSVVIMPNSITEDGVFIAPNTTIAIGCHIRPHVVVNQNVSVGHDCIIEDFSVISPGSVLSGRTTIGEQTFFGSGAITYPGVRIGKNCVVSACTVVARNLKANHKQILKPNTMIIPS